MSAFLENLNIFLANFCVQNSEYVLKFFLVIIAKFLQGSTAMTFFLEKFFIKTPSLLPIFHNNFWIESFFYFIC